MRPFRINDHLEIASPLKAEKLNIHPYSNAYSNDYGVGI